MTVQIAVGFGHGQWDSYLVHTTLDFDEIQDLGDIDLTAMVQNQLPENAVVSFAKVIHIDEEDSPDSNTE